MFDGYFIGDSFQDETKRIDSLWNRIDDLFTTSNPAGATKVVNETKREIEAIEQKQLELTRTMPPEWPIVPINIVPELDFAHFKLCKRWELQRNGTG